MKVYLGADHRGFDAKESLKSYLSEKGWTVIDEGALTKEPTDDYPDFAYPVAKAVAEEPGSRGVLLCGSGMGMDVVANKVRGVRATVGYSKDAIIHARAHDDINVLTLAADVLSAKEIGEFVESFLETPLDPGERHMRRLKKIEEIENNER
ncbi:MAG: RpiB/LacA/LacB family sugar-phosphate isomerase [Patescibacteria group bacterium]|nr:RpiB/LacA/LacB family sugar-phosphate isomerase [Patescibacteria group bacterium]